MKENPFSLWIRPVRTFNPLAIMLANARQVTETQFTWLAARLDDADAMIPLLDKMDAGEIPGDWLSDNEIVLTEDNGYMHRDDAQWCEYEDAYYSDSAPFVTITRRRRDELNVHHDNASEIGFFCERTNEWYHSGDYTEIDVEGETVCREANEDDLYYWESDDEYHWEPEDDEGNGGISDYHYRPRPNAWNKAEGYGIELEVKFPDRESRRNFADSESWICERDGSLCEEKGMELVGPPLACGAISDAWLPRLASMRNEGCKGHDAGDGYGLHVNVSNSLFQGALHLAKFVFFLDGCPGLCKCVARRDAIYNGSYGNVEKLASAGKPIGKYVPCAIKTGRVEVRIFRSTLKDQSFLACVEFCQAVLDFTRDVPASGDLRGKPAESAFIQYLNQAPGLANLKSFLADKNWPGVKTPKKTK